MSRFKTLWVAVLGAAAMTAYGFLDDQHLTNVETVQVVSAAVGAFLVWLTTNGPEGTAWRHAKALAYGASAVLATLVTTLPNGVTTAREVVALVIAFATGAGVLSLRNKPQRETVVVSE